MEDHCRASSFSFFLSFFFFLGGGDIYITPTEFFRTLTLRDRIPINETRDRMSDEIKLKRFLPHALTLSVGRST